MGVEQGKQPNQTLQWTGPALSVLVTSAAGPRGAGHWTLIRYPAIRNPARKTGPIIAHRGSTQALVSEPPTVDHFPCMAYRRSNDTGVFSSRWRLSHRAASRDLGFLL